MKGGSGLLFHAFETGLHTLVLVENGLKRGFRFLLKR